MQYAVLRCLVINKSKLISWFKCRFKDRFKGRLVQACPTKLVLALGGGKRSWVEIQVVGLCVLLQEESLVSMVKSKYQAIVG
jgi:hypothetical protein